jgi:hypothetical protein
MRGVSILTNQPRNLSGMALVGPGDDSYFAGTRPAHDRTPRMDLAAFRASLDSSDPPRGLTLALEALWHDGRGDFDTAHGLAQRDEGGEGDWVHAYLHRKEGDAGNAAYWYRRAKRPVCHEPLEAEWAAIAGALLKKAAA